MAPLSCRDLPARLPTLPCRATAHTQVSFLRAPAPRRPLTTTTTASTSASTPRLPLAATRDEAVASLVGQLEHDVAHVPYRDDAEEDEDEEEEEEDLYHPDGAPNGRRRRRAVKQHEDELPTRWREIHGCDDWAGLLDPMDPLLRSELIRYGELAQACYDAFDYDPSSRYCGSCKHPRRELFERLGMPGAARGYAVSRYLYATSNFRFPNLFPQSRAGARIWSQSANWIGYVAVSTDEESARLGRRDIAIAWRGTVTRLEWVSDLMDFLRPVADEGIPCPDPDVKVLAGFVDLYTDKDPTCRFCKYSAREQVLMEVRRLVGRGREHHRHRAQPRQRAGHAERVRHRRVRRERGRDEWRRRRRRRRADGGAGVRVLVRGAAGGERGVQAAVRGGARREGAAGGERARQRDADAGDPGERGGARGGAARGGEAAAGALVLLPRRRGAGARPQEVAVPQGHARPGVLPRPGGAPTPHRRVPRARGEVRAGKRARPGAGEQGVRLPQGSPRRAPLLAPGREQGHGARPRRALGPARPPRVAPGRPRPRPRGSNAPPP